MEWRALNVSIRSSAVRLPTGDPATDFCSRTSPEKTGTSIGLSIAPTTNSGDLSSKLAMVANEDVVALLPAYMRHQTSPGVVIVPVADARAT